MATVRHFISCGYNRTFLLLWLLSDISPLVATIGHFFSCGYYRTFDNLWRPSAISSPVATIGHFFSCGYYRTFDNLWRPTAISSPVATVPQSNQCHYLSTFCTPLLAFARFLFDLSVQKQHRYIYIPPSGIQSVLSRVLEILHHFTCQRHCIITDLP